MSDLRDFIQRKVDAGDLMNTTLAASVSGVPRTEVTSAASGGRLPAIKIGTAHGSDEYLIVFEDLIAWADRRRQEWIDEAKRLTAPRRKRRRG